MYTAPVLLPMPKSQLRQALLARRRVIPHDLVSTTQWKVANHVRTLISDISPSIIALYMPLEGEIDLTPLAEDLRQMGNTLALPRVVAKKHPLAFNVWAEGDPLEPDALGLSAATGAEVWPRVIIVPMVGYTKQGHRVGYGGGYYDRTLAEAPFPTLTIGVCYTELEAGVLLQPEAHDKKLDFIVTGKEVIAPLDK
ncbi:MAG: 5-formyltetrahydrofolate cyclo-ligase [Alphaproteobacteria bacterium CG_4_10_14_0_8_um_filter_53_9]|nr:MAG: 5-formyltetrahydrofolate cyclo-ligase [Alphaproteobacteria bacterium CG_4_10_14_0_8_um_filter_53_9]